jgi:hypothetical protein
MPIITRPPVKVLPPDAQLPERNVLQPVPNVFTHKLVVSQPYYYDEPPAAQLPAGEWTAGTLLIVIRVVQGYDYCWVADGNGRYVVTLRAGLRSLTNQHSH